MIGTHNSYHAGLLPSIAQLVQQKDPEAFKELDYKHAEDFQPFQRLDVDRRAFDEKTAKVARPKTAAEAKKLVDCDDPVEIAAGFQRQ